MFCGPVHAWHDSHFPDQCSGIKDQHNGLCQFSVVVHVISFCGVGPKKKWSNQIRTVDELKLTNSRYICHWSSYSLRKSVKSLSTRLHLMVVYGFSVGSRIVQCSI